MTALRRLDPAELHGRPLTERELQILTLAAHGLSNGEIGRQLFMATVTVQTHMRIIVRKLGAHGRTHAVHLAHDLITAKEQTR